MALLARNAWWPRLLGLVRQLDKAGPEQMKLLGSCAGHFRRAGEYGAAKETLLRMEDMQVGSGLGSGLYHVKLLGSCAGHCRQAGEYGGAKGMLLQFWRHVGAI